MSRTSPLAFPRLPDWLVYLAIFTTIVATALSRKEHADAPPPPPPMDVLPDQGPPGLFSRHVHGTSMRQISTAFSVAADGSWISVLPDSAGCAPVYLALSERPAILARRTSTGQNHMVLLTTSTGTPGMPRYPEASLQRGQRGFHLGYVRGQPAELSSRYLGQVAFRPRYRGSKAHSVSAWAETGRTIDLNGDLKDLYGSPVLDDAGRVMVVTLGSAPRRGRLYTSTLSATREALALSTELSPTPHPDAEPVTIENYGRMADDLRRSLQIAQVQCPAS